MDEVRCSHPKQEWIDAKGKKYRASHERVAGRKRICITSQHGLQGKDHKGQTTEEAGKGTSVPCPVTTFVKGLGIGVKAS